jgi:amino acid permease
MPELNWLAIIVAAVVIVVVSTVYYIIFGSQLKQLSAAYANAESRPPPWKVVLELVRGLVVATVVASLISLIGITDL